MRKQEFNSKLISLPPLGEVPVHVPLRRPRPLRFERLPVPVWNPYSRGRLSPAKSEDRKGGEGKTDANLTNFFLAPAAPAPQLARHAPGRLPTRPLCRKIQPNVLRCNRLARGGPPGDIIPGNCRTEGEAGFYSLTPRTPTRR